MSQKKRSRKKRRPDAGRSGAAAGAYPAPGGKSGAPAAPGAKSEVPAAPGGRPGASERARSTDRSAAVEPVRHPRPSVGQVRADLASSGQKEGSPGMLVAALLGTTLFMFFYLHVLVLPQMTQLTGGLSMPDQMFGYDAAYLAELAAAMDEPAHGQLNWVHKTAGVIFPIAVGLSVAAVAAWCLPRGGGRWVSYAAGAVFAVVDIVENMLIESALRAGGEGAGLASAFTVSRWVLLGAITAWIVVMLIGKARRSARRRVDEMTRRVRRR